MTKPNENIKGNKATSDKWIPRDWSRIRLDRVGTFLKGKGISKEQLSRKGIPCVRYGEIYTFHNIVIKQFGSFIDYKIAKESTPLKINDILFTGSGETREDIGKAVAYLHNDLAYAGGDVIILRPLNGISSLFLSYALDSNDSRHQKYRLGEGHSVVHIYPEELSSIQLSLPPLPEQNAIASILSTWDKTIENTHQLMDRKLSLKKALMQQILTGKKRLPGFTEKWKIKELGTILIPISRRVEKPSKSFLALGIRSHGKGTFLKQEFDPTKIEMDTLYKVKENDLIINITFAWEGAVAIAGLQDDGALVSHRFPTYTFNPEEGILDYFRYVIIQPRFKYMLGMISPGGAGRNRVLSKSDFLKIQLKLPAIKEQIAIAKVLMTEDKELELLTQKLVMLKEQKRGLMQKLLTGQIRVKTLESKL